MRLTYFGHSCFLLEVAGVRIVFDPYLRKNPHGSVDPAQVPRDFVLCSHAHEDHTADAMNLATFHGATIVAPYELAAYFSSRGARTFDLMPGGGTTLSWGRITMTPAIHRSSIELLSAPSSRFRCTTTATKKLRPIRMRLSWPRSKPAIQLASCPRAKPSISEQCSRSCPRNTLNTRKSELTEEIRRFSCSPNCAFILGKSGSSRPSCFRVFSVFRGHSL
jgi:hypothetical protein